MQSVPVFFGIANLLIFGKKMLMSKSVSRDLYIFFGSSLGKV